MNIIEFQGQVIDIIQFQSDFKLRMEYFKWYVKKLRNREIFMPDVRNLAYDFVFLIYNNRNWPKETYRFDQLNF